MLVELFKFFGRHPQLFDTPPAGDLNGESRDVSIFDLKASNEAHKS